MDLTFLEKKGTISLILRFLGRGPLRFKDLRKVIPREATLSNRIRKLEDLGLIEAVPIKDGRRNFFAYRLTDKGNATAKKLKEI